MMKYLLSACVLACLLLQANSERLPDHQAANRANCRAETGLKQASSTAAYLAQPSAKCYLKCMFEKNGLFSASQSILVDRALTLVDPSIHSLARPVAQSCINKYANIPDKCEKSYAMIKCMYDLVSPIFGVLGLFEPPQI